MEVQCHSHIDRVIVGVVLCMVDDLLCVIEQETTEEDQATIHVDSMEAREQGCAWSSEHATCVCVCGGGGGGGGVVRC